MRPLGICPFCKENEAELYDDSGTKYQVICYNCGGRTGECDKAQDAIDLWNGATED